MVRPKQTREYQLYAAIVSAPLSGGRASILVQDAYLPATGRKGLYFVRAAGPSRNTKAGAAEFWLLPTGGGKPRMIHSQAVGNDEQIRAQCVAGDHLVWATGKENGTGWLTILSDSGQTKRLDLPQGAWDTYLTCGSDLIGWGAGGPTRGDDDGEFLYSLSRGTLWKLGSNPTLGRVMVNGTTVAWSTPKPAPEAPVGYRVVRWLH